MLLTLIPGNQAFIFADKEKPAKIKVPSSLAIFVAAAGLTNYKQRNSLKQSSRKAPQKSLVHQLV